MNQRNENRTGGRWLGGPPLNMSCGVVLSIVILAVVLGFVPIVRFCTDFVWYDALVYATVFGFVFILSLGIIRFSLMWARKTELPRLFLKASVSWGLQCFS